VKEVQDHTQPAKAGGNQGAAYIGHSDFGREGRSVGVPKPEDLAECADDNKELGRNSNLSPTFSGHGAIVGLRNCS